MPAKYRLMNEYGCDVPLWDDEGPLGKDRLPQGLSPATFGMLSAWASQFEEHFDHLRGWDSDWTARKHAQDAEALLAAVSADLGPGVQVQLNLWEVGDVAEPD